MAVVLGLVLLACGVALMGGDFARRSGGAVDSAAAGSVQAEAGEASALRIGVLALADTIAALGRHPELAEPLPFTSTSIANALRLDDVVSNALIQAMAGTDLVAALEEVPGFVDIIEEDLIGGVSYAYEQTVKVPLKLAYDDGDLRIGLNSGAGMLNITLQTREGGERFVVAVDEDQTDPLLQFALISEPELELIVQVDTQSITAFAASQGFTELDVTGGSYTVDRAIDITLRDPNGRGELTLEDLMFSTLTDLFRMDERVPDDVDITFDISLPTDIAVVGGDDASHLGQLTLTRASDPESVWPDPASADRNYGDALAALTGLTFVDGITSFAHYTGAALALQNKADVNFPNLGGGIADVFTPGDELLDLLATSGVAEIRCGLAPGNPPIGVPAPGDAVYCDAVTATGIDDDELIAASWSVSDGYRTDRRVGGAERPQRWGLCHRRPERQSS
jgi:hypothetical protein